MKTYIEIFENNTEEALVKAVRNGMNVYLRNYSISYSDYNDYETFFEAAVRYGTPALVNACIDMGADVNCVAPIKAQRTSPRAVTSSLIAAMRAYNPETLRALFERGARTGVLNNLEWEIQRNFIPEAENDEEAMEIKQRLNIGSKILKVLKDVGFRVPGLDRDDDKMSFCNVGFTACYNDDIDEETIGEKYTAWEDWDGEYADGGDDDENKPDRYCEGLESEYDYSSDVCPYHGTRPGALWHAASPEALRFMIEVGVDVNARDTAGWTMMHHVAYYHDKGYYFNPKAILQILLDSGADINARGRCGLTPLMLAAENYISDDWEADMFNFLLKNGADFRAVDNNGCGIWDSMTYSWSSHNPRFDKFMYQQILLELCRSEGIAITNDSSSLINNNWGEVGEAVEFLIANGEYPGLIRLEREKANARRMTDDLQKFGLKPGRFFKDVFNKNSAEAIADAIKNGLDMSLEDEGKESFLIAAMRYGASEVVQALVDRGINVNKYGRWIFNFRRIYPLYTAIEAHNADAVEILLKAGADPMKVNNMPWHERTNIFPEGNGKNEEAKEFKKRLNAGAKILRMLKEAGVNVPAAGDEELTYVGIGHDDGRRRDSVQRQILRNSRRNKDIDNNETVMTLRRAASPEAIKLLIDAGIDVNTQDHEGRTVMHWLADDWNRYFNPNAMFKVLIKSGSDVNACDDKGKTPLMLLIRYVIEHPCALEAVKYLLIAGADFEAEDFNGYSVYFRLQTNIVERLWKNLPLSDLFVSIVGIFASKYQKKVKKLAWRKAEVDLMTIACWGSVAQIESAMLRGADVNARSVNGYTPLMFASSFNTKEAVQFLIGKGANVNARSNNRGDTALILASKRQWCDPDVFRALIEAGADVNARDDGDNTPLILVAGTCDANEISSILIKAGADIHAKNKYGKTALNEAMYSFMSSYRPHLKVAGILIAAGADIKCFLDEKDEYEVEDENEGEDEDENEGEGEPESIGEDGNNDNITAKNRKIIAYLLKYGLNV